MERLSDIPVRYLKGIGPKRAEAFAAYGVRSVEDLFYHFPRRYEDRTKFSTIAQLQEGIAQTIKVSVMVSGQRRSWRRKGFSITEAMVEDASGRLSCVWFNQPYLKQYLKPGTEMILYGKVERYGAKLQLTNPEFEVLSEEKDETFNVGRITPVYPLIAGIGQRTMRKLIKEILDKYISRIHDALPYDIRARHNLLNLAQSLINIHFPEEAAVQQEAYRRLAFEEFFIFQLPLAIRKAKKKEELGIAHSGGQALVAGFVQSLPFALTASQKAVVKEIADDMARPHPMHRLLQGDVGSGKTVVATIASMICVGGGYQAAFMVPTEILAKQHYEKIKKQLEGMASEKLAREATDTLVRQGSRAQVGIALLTSSIAAAEKEKAFRQIAKGEVDLVIGTHALLEQDVQFKKLGLVVIDEQHRFGVGQRCLLPQKGINPDVLIMTATPIPRTLAITLYGDLDVSAISELPPGRQPIRTAWITDFKRPWLYDGIRAAVKRGRQVYVVYPLIEESSALDLLSAKKMYAEFKETVFKDCSVGIIHGRLKQKEQDKVMLEFKSNKIQILIATTVLEVGIDVPNATLMVIEQAERFGLSQLHQLRGRVGRGEHASSCIMVSGAHTPDAKARLEAMVEYADGFKIAEEDLKIRGPGEYFGSRQHGLTGLRIGNPLTQMQLLKNAREEALTLVTHDPDLRERPNALLKEKLLQRFPEYEKLMMVG